MGNQGFEPRVPEATDLQSAAVANAARYPKQLKRWQLLELKHRQSIAPRQNYWQAFYGGAPRIRTAKVGDAWVTARCRLPYLQEPQLIGTPTGIRTPVR